MHGMDRYTSRGNEYQAGPMSNSIAGMLSRRTQIVWAAFAATMILILGLMGLGGSEQSQVHENLVLTRLGALNDRPADDPVFHTDVVLDRSRWTAIVIHHLGEPAGSADSVGRSHRGAGLDGLGYHFLIGNGNGTDDGVVEAGYRWLQQLPGAHVPGTADPSWNERSIGICLVGTGDRRPFTDLQMKHLARLVQRLQQELGIPAGNVRLCREISANADTSPGGLFEEAWLRGQLIDR